MMTNTPSKNGATQALDSQSTSETPSLDVLFDVLANQRRRHALRCLREFQTPMALADLASEVARCEQETPVPDIPAEEVKRVYMSLYHTHVPKLAEANVVEYSQERDLVALSVESERIEPFVEPAARDE